MFDNLANCYFFPNLKFIGILPKQEHDKTVRNVGTLILPNYSSPSNAVMSYLLTLSTEAKGNDDEEENPVPVSG